MNKYILLFLTSIAFYSCGIYRQNVVNTPLFQQKKQTQIAAHVGFTGLNAQASYALTNHIGMFANYCDMGTKRTSFSTINYSIDKHNFGEIGAGYYHNNKTGFTYEIFLVAGNGMGSNFSAGGDTIPGHTKPFENFKKANYNRFLIQADFGLSEGQFNFALTPRIFVLQYYNITDTESDIYKTISNRYLCSDLALTGQYKMYKNLILSAQMGVTRVIAGQKIGYYEYSPFNCSIGFILHLNFSKFSDRQRN
jgi:hypothetical protein